MSTTTAAPLTETQQQEAAIYRDAARTAIEGKHTPLQQLLPGAFMPTPSQLAIVHSIAGTSEVDRVDERPNFRKSAQTESAWCRAMLKRWAAREQGAQ